MVRCPRCGSMDAESLEAVHVELDHMGCRGCGHRELCDDYEIKDRWNETLPGEQIRRDVWHVLPSVRLFESWRALGASEPSRRTWLELNAAYAEPHRAYHTARHVGDCLRLLDEPEVAALAERPAEVEAALWFHDAVYDPRRRDNEERSAQWARDALTAAGVAPDRVRRIAVHILATRDHENVTGDGALVVDLDLAVLGSSATAFARFEREIRQEFAWVDDAAYRSGRSRVLKGFADRFRLFTHEVFRERFEVQARENLRHALARVGDAGPG